jgi:hypothetical protein
MVGRPSSSTAAHSASAKRKQPLLNPGRLAAALGLSNIMTKMKAPALAMPGHALQGATRLPKLGVSSARWHSAASSQHVRSILQVCYEAQGLKLGKCLSCTRAVS